MMYRKDDVVEYYNGGPWCLQSEVGKRGVVLHDCLSGAVDVRWDGEINPRTFLRENVRLVGFRQLATIPPACPPTPQCAPAPQGVPKDPNPKDSIGAAKLPMHLWPESATALGCLALLDGALKYGRSNYRATPVRASIYVDAAKRHIGKWFEGRDKDTDSGLHELGHALACLAILVDAEVHGTLIDDRMYVPGKGYLSFYDELTKHVPRLQKLHADKMPKHYTKEDNVPT